ncbi:MAG TPA: transporter substrate-binding domain-containing protein [Burkholderiaceae bacterium]|jgi:polar amino acid transport system substrate-binding protein|nr:transporter substrate-binding domain-containing protein [Burkholderiaceae bacterium]
MRTTDPSLFPHAMHRFFAVTMLVSAMALLPRAMAQELKIGVGNFKPYFDGNTGLFTDLIVEVFKEMPQYQTKISPTPMSNYRLLEELNAGAIDGAANIFLGDKINGCLSEPFFRYDDVVITLKKRKIIINSIADLKDKSIITYQNAKLFQPKEFAQIVDAKPALYHETPIQTNQVKMLALERVQVSVGDAYIFLDSLKEWKASPYKASDFEFHRVLPANSTYMAFRDPKLCAEFNRAAAKIKENGRYEAIYKAYLAGLQ